MKWGMVLPNSTDIVINGRLEELYSKPFFRNLLEGKRCVLATNGYYEWSKDAPILIQPSKACKPTIDLKSNKLKPPETQTNDVLMFACLYNHAALKQGLGDSYNSFVILTMPSEGHLQKVHHRMPVFLDEESRKVWLDPKVSFRKCLELIEKTDLLAQLDCVEVSNKVSSVRN